MKRIIIYKLNLLYELLSNMGVRYLSYRLFYELQRQTGFLKRKFPTDPPNNILLDLAEWRKSTQSFFFQSRETIALKKNPTDSLKEAFENILSGKIQFFSSQYFDLGVGYDWITNPDNGYRYDIRKHWIEVNEYRKKDGDIKYVWEKSRFSFLYTIIRYDYHFEKDNSQFVFGQITDWIEKNPLNCGPNYKCSQEISLRIMNWTFALYFYKNSKSLTEDIFSMIIHSIYWQLLHVYRNINFSRICVRNNHAITETLMIYIGGLLFHFFPESKTWKEKGKKWFEQEIAYQIYKDGTFLQFSMNYHRVVIQLLTWAIRLSDIHKEKLNDIVYERAYKSLNFLYQCQEDSNGFLPNYGSNDGALFFKLSENDYRDYRTQLDALHVALTGESLYQTSMEDRFWYGNNSTSRFQPLKKQFGILRFENGGYYLFREPETLTFIRCGQHKDRPSHADNLHLDIWHKGKNILPDCGSYKYNTTNESLKYFWGTASHNSVMLDNQDQMLKGNRFIWYFWSQAVDIQIKEEKDFYEFKGSVSCFRHLSRRIIHKREVRKMKNKPEWKIEDRIENKPKSAFMKQIWHIPYMSDLYIESDHPLKYEKSDCSFYYGLKEKISQFSFRTLYQENVIRTKITVL